MKVENKIPISAFLIDLFMGIIYNEFERSDYNGTEKRIF